MCFWCPSPKRSISFLSICELQVWSQGSYRWTNRHAHVSAKAAGFSVSTWAFICISVDCKSHPESSHGAAIKQNKTESNLMCSHPHVQPHSQQDCTGRRRVMMLFAPQGLQVSGVDVCVTGLICWGIVRYPFGMSYPDVTMLLSALLIIIINRFVA